MQGPYLHILSHHLRSVVPSRNRVVVGWVHPRSIRIYTQNVPLRKPVTQCHFIIYLILAHTHVEWIQKNGRVSYLTTSSGNSSTTSFSFDSARLIRFAVSSTFSRSFIIVPFAGFACRIVMRRAYTGFFFESSSSLSLSREAGVTDVLCQKQQQNHETHLNKMRLPTKANTRQIELSCSQTFKAIAHCLKNLHCWVQYVSNANGRYLCKYQGKYSVKIRVKRDTIRGQVVYNPSLWNAWEDLTANLDTVHIFIVNRILYAVGQQ